MLDEDLADLYGVATKRLVEQVKRNLDRFPGDFMFQLDRDEAASLRSQIATSKSGRGGCRYAPYAFTEQGVAMLSSVLRSSRESHRQSLFEKLNMTPAIIARMNRIARAFPNLSVTSSPSRQAARERSRGRSIQTQTGSSDFYQP